VWGRRLDLKMVQAQLSEELFEWTTALVYQKYISSGSLKRGEIIELWEGYVALGFI
jgi:hypothetical protein